MCDGGEKYLDTVLNDDWMRSKGIHSPAAEAAEQGVLALLDTFDDEAHLGVPAAAMS